jgi:hypothetical protein
MFGLELSAMAQLLQNFVISCYTNPPHCCVQMLAAAVAVAFASGVSFRKRKMGSGWQVFVPPKRVIPKKRAFGNPQNNLLWTSHTSTPTIFTLQKLGLGITKAFALHIEEMQPENRLLRTHKIP